MRMIYHWSNAFKHRLRRLPFRSSVVSSFRRCVQNLRLAARSIGRGRAHLHDVSDGIAVAQKLSQQNIRPKRGELSLPLSIPLFPSEKSSREPHYLGGRHAINESTAVSAPLLRNRMERGRERRGEHLSSSSLLFGAYSSFHARPSTAEESPQN